MQVADKTVVIAGLGVSGTSLAEVLRERGTHVIGVDERKPEADLHSFDDVDWNAWTTSCRPRCSTPHPVRAGSPTPWHPRDERGGIRMAAACE